MTSAQVFQTVNVTTNRVLILRTTLIRTIIIYRLMILSCLIRRKFGLGEKAIFNSLLMIFWIMVINCLSKEIWFNKNNFLTVLSGRQRHSQIWFYDRYAGVKRFQIWTVLNFLRSRPVEKLNLTKMKSRNFSSYQQILLRRETWSRKGKQNCIHGQR